MQAIGKLKVSTLFIGLFFLCGNPLLGDNQTWKVEVGGKTEWKDTGADVRAGDKLLITATGTLQYPSSQPTGPDGLPRGWADLLRQLPVGEAGRGALIGRIGDGDAALPFRVGARRQLDATESGRLYLSVNQGKNDESHMNSGSSLLSVAS